MPSTDFKVGLLGMLSGNRTSSEHEDVYPTLVSLGSVLNSAAAANLELNSKGKLKYFNTKPYRTFQKLIFAFFTAIKTLPQNFDFYFYFINWGGNQSFKRSIFWFKRSKKSIFQKLLYENLC